MSKFMYRSEGGPAFGPVREKELRRICDGSDDILISPAGREDWVPAHDYFRSPKDFFQASADRKGSSGQERPRTGFLGFLVVFIGLLQLLMGAALALPKVAMKFGIQDSWVAAGLLVGGSICLHGVVTRRR